MRIPSDVEAKAAGVLDEETVARRARLAHAGLPNAEEVALGRKASRRARFSASFRREPVASVVLALETAAVVALLGYGIGDAITTGNRPEIIPAPSPITLSVTPEEVVVGSLAASVLFLGVGCVLWVGENRRK